MKIAILLFLVTCFGMSSKKLKSPPTPQPVVKKKQLPFLYVISYKQFDFPKVGSNTRDPQNEHFDFTDFAKDHDTIYTVSDQEGAKAIYSLHWGQDKEAGIIEKAFSYNISEPLRVEAMGVCDNIFYLSSQRNDSLFILKEGETPQKINFDLKKIKIRRDILSGGIGFHSLAIDCDHHIAYLVNNKEPRFILTYDLVNKKILDHWDILDSISAEFVNAKFETGYNNKIYLYLLNSEDMSIAKLDLNTREIVKEYSYQNFEKAAGYLYAPSKHPLAKAMLLTESEIWIGFNNRGLYTGRDAEKDLHINGKRPLVLRLQRPKGF